VGKSTLYNQLVDREADKAEVSPIPGTTRQNQVADTGLFKLVDTPGADAVGEVGERERRIAFQAAAEADFLVIVFEATQGIRRYEKDLFDRLLLMEKPFVVVLNKVDLVPAEDREAVLEAAARNLGISSSQIIETVAPEGTNVGRVVLAIAKFEPRLLAAIANAMPQYRAKLAWQRIVPAAGSAGVVGLAPLPIMDLLPLLGIQAGLVLSLARVYGYKITLGRAKELIATFGMGFGARMIFQQLLKLGGVPGWVLSAAVAAATTVAIGYAAMLWFAYGERPTQERLRETIASVTQHLSDQLKGLGKRRPDKVTLRERIVEGLQNLPSPYEWLQAMRPDKSSTEKKRTPRSEPSREDEGTIEPS
jgi:GTP-binding protein Era